MRRLILPVLACVLICFSNTDTAFPKGGRGGGGGGNGGGRSTTQRGNHGGGNRQTSSPQNHGSGNRQTFTQQGHGGGNHQTFTQQGHGGGNRPTTAGRPQQVGGPASGHSASTQGDTGSATQQLSGSTTQQLTGRGHALNLQNNNEQRILNHRLQTAQHLRDVAAKNGNQNLLNNADRMEQRAYDHYNSRLNRINGVNGDVADGLTNSATNLAGGNTGQQLLQSGGNQLLNSTPLGPGNVANSANSVTDSFSRQLANEQRKLQHQLDVAQQLRDISARNGNQNLLNTADRMEQMAVNRYEQQLEKFGIPDPDTTMTNAATNAVTNSVNSTVTNAVNNAVSNAVTDAVDTVVP
jgi:hypothetical protein